MKPEDAAIRLSLHLMQCGMMMPFEWVKENGEGSELQQAFRMALDALQENEELRKENGVVKEELERVRKAHEDLCGYEDTELEPGQVKDGIGDKAPCPLCDNARANGELTDRNDLHYITVGDSEGGFRVMVGAGWGRPMRILFEQRRRVHPNRNEEAWMTVGIYEPKFCPNCGRELREYGGQK